MDDLRDRALLSRLHISRWGGRKRDAHASQETAHRYSAHPDLCRVNKKLVRSETLDRVASIANAARVFHYRNSLPWGDDGSRIIPISHYWEYTQGLGQHREEFEAAVKEFIGEYPHLVRHAQRHLGRLFNPNDYPSIEEIPGKFAWELKFFPIPSGDDFRVSLAGPELERLRANLNESLAQVVREAASDLLARLRETLAVYWDRMAGDKILKSAVVRNLRDTAIIVQKFNLIDDKRISAIAQEIQGLAEKYGPDDLREHDVLKKRAREEAEKILAKLEGVHNENV